MKCDSARFAVSEALAAGKPRTISPDAIRAILYLEYPTIN